jgi:hypothetical protein
LDLSREKNIMAQPRARITGEVLVVEVKALGAAGTFKFKEARVQTGPAQIESVRFTDEWQRAHDAPRSGDFIDVEVECSGFAGRNGVEISLVATAPFNEKFAEEQFSKLTAA